MFATEKPATPDLVHGRRPSTPSAPPTCARSASLLLATGNVGAPGHRRQHLPRPHQRAGRDRPRPRYRDPAALLRPGRGRVAALVAGLGGAVRLVRRPLRQDPRTGRQRNQHDEHAGHPVDPLVRRDALRQEGRQAEGQHQGDVRHGSRRQHRDAHAAGAEGHRGARTARRLPIRSRPPGRRWRRRARTARISCRSPPATRPPARARRPTARSSGASRSSSRSSSPRTTTR